jgi:hypothetical protein
LSIIYCGYPQTSSYYRNDPATSKNTKAHIDRSFGDNKKWLNIATPKQQLAGFGLPEFAAGTGDVATDTRSIPRWVC